MTTTAGGRAAWARQAALTLGAVLGVVCLLVAAGAALCGLRPLVFRSGSMSPTIETGALAFSREVDAARLRVGDVVSVPTGDGQRVTHRIVRVTHRGGTATLWLRGDANPVPDARAYVVRHADRVLFDVPVLGRAVGWASGPAGQLLLGLYVAFLLSVVAPRSPVEVPSTGRDRSATLVGAGLALVLAGGLVAGVVLGQRTTPTLAAWANTAAVSGTTLTAYTVPAPGTATCTPGGTTTTRTVAYRWAASATPALTNTVTISGITGATSAATASGGSTTLTISYPTAGNASKYATITVRASLQSTPTWASTTSTFKFRTGTGTGTATCGETDAPTLTFRAPDATTRTVANERAYVNSASGCVYTGIALCGYRSDTSTITSVVYQFQRVQAGATQCWNGTGWVAGACTAYRTAAMDVYQNQTVWYDNGDVNAAYNLPGTYTLTVRVTDEWGNVGNAAVTFTLT